MNDLDLKEQRLRRTLKAVAERVPIPPVEDNFWTRGAPTSSHRPGRILVGVAAAVVIVAGAVFAIAYGPRSTDVGGSRLNDVTHSSHRLPTGVDYLWVPTQSGIVPINVVSHSVGQPFRAGAILDYAHQYVAFAPRGHVAYVLTPGGYAPLSLTTGDLGKAIPHTGQWGHITMAPNGRTFYLTDYSSITGKGSDEVVPVNTVTRSVEAPITIPGGRPVVGLAIAPDGTTAYVVTNYDADIRPLNLITRVVGPPISVSDGVSALAFAPGGTMAYAVGATAVGQTGCHLIPINVLSGVVGPPVTLGFQPHSIVISSDGRAAYLTDGYGVRFIDLATGKLTMTIHLPGAGDVFAAPL